MGDTAVSGDTLTAANHEEFLFRQAASGILNCMELKYWEPKYLFRLSHLQINVN